MVFMGQSTDGRAADFARGVVLKGPWETFGDGFSDMHFKTLATSRAEFDAWVSRAKASGKVLDRNAYRTLEQPSSKDPVTLYGAVAPRLFDGVVDKYMLANGQVCRADGTEALLAARPAVPASVSRTEQ